MIRVLTIGWMSFCLLNSISYSQQRMTVAKDGSGDFTSVQKALDAVQEGKTDTTIIFIRRGEYREVVTVDARKNFIRLIGEEKENTILTYDNHAGTLLPNGDTLNTWTCASFFVYGNDFSAENLTFRNTAGFTAGQAVGLRIEGNRALIRNCRIIGNQDILFLSGSGVKHYFVDCYLLSLIHI